MHHYLIRRTLSMILTLFIASILTFSLLHTLPGGTTEMVIKHVFVGLEEGVTEELRTAISERYNLDVPLYSQYWSWLTTLITRGDLGISYKYDRPVISIIQLYLPATMQLAIAGFLIVVLIGLPIGAYAAFHENAIPDHIIRLVTILGVSFPSFWLGLIFIMIFSITLGWFPTSGYGEWSHLVLPAVTLAVYTTALIIRMMRTSTLETLSKPFILYANAKGIPRRAILKDHALRNALLPIVTILGIQFGHMLAGTMIIETVFAWPGIGSLLVSSTLARDLPMVTGLIVLIIAMVLIVNLIVDILCIFIDPRIRYE